MKDLVTYFRFKILECRISTIDEKIENLHKLGLFLQRRFEDKEYEKVRSKIDYLFKRKTELLSGIQYSH